MPHLKVRKVGNSLGVILPKDVLARLNVAEGDELVVSDAPDGVTIGRADADFADDVKAAEKIMDRYRNALAELAK